VLKVKPIVLALLGVIGTQAYAATDNGQQLQQQINQIIAQQQQLQAQVASLQQQLAAAKAVNQQAAAQPAATGNTSKTSFVRIGSYEGLTSTYSGSDLVANIPNILANKALLLQRYSEDTLAQKAGIPEEETPYMVLSGELEGHAKYAKTNGHGSASSDIDFTDAELYMNMVANKWVSGLATVAYDNSVDAYSPGFNRVEQSRVYLNKGFITIGNFEYSPIYGSVGQMYVPFGRYSYGSVSSPLTKLLFRTKARALSVGYYQTEDDGLDTSLYTFQATGGTEAQKTKIENFGADAAYHFKLDSGFSGNGGVGYINNVADSQGMLDNGLGGVCVPGGEVACFNGFGWNNVPLLKSVGGYDGHVSVSYSQFTILAEYVTAATQFDARDLSMANPGADVDTFEDLRGAKPTAFDTEAIYNFTAGKIPASLVLNYDFTRQALALALPKTSYGSTVNFDICAILCLA